MDLVVDSKEKRLNNLIREAEESELYTTKSRKQILEFVSTCKAKGLSVSRICFYMDRLKTIGKCLKKDFDKWEKKDVEFVMSKIGERKYSQHTIEAIKTTFKVFYRWINDLDKTDPAPKLVRWLSKENVPNKIRREDLLTEKEIQDMVNATNKPMVKALISVLYAGARPGEILGIRIRDVKETNGRIRIYVRGKTGKKMGERPLYILKHQDLFRSWIRRHPEKNEPESKLFISRNGALRYNNMNHIIKRVAKRAGIRKKINCYLFRHGAGTRYYASQKGSVARRVMGHAAGSKMEAVYCHLSDDDVEDIIFGKKTIEDIEPDIPSMEKETEDLIQLGKSIKKLAEMHPEVIDIERLQKIVSA